MGIISVIGTVVVGGYMYCAFTNKTGILTKLAKVTIEAASGMVDKYIHDYDLDVQERIQKIEMKRVKVEQVKEEDPGKYEIYL